MLSHSLRLGLSKLALRLSLRLSLRLWLWLILWLRLRLWLRLLLWLRLSLRLWLRLGVLGVHTMSSPWEATTIRTPKPRLDWNLP